VTQKLFENHGLETLSKNGYRDIYMYMSAFLAMQHAAHACQHIILVFVGKFRTWYLGLGTSCHVVKTVMSETVMFENVMFATARFETVMCESVMFDSVMFETVRWARRDCFMNTPVAAAWLGCHMESVTSIKSLAGSHGAEYCTAHASKAHRKFYANKQFQQCYANKQLRHAVDSCANNLVRCHNLKLCY